MNVTYIHACVQGLANQCYISVYCSFNIILCLSRGGIQSILGKPELQKVMQRRKPDADGKIGSIRPPERNGVTQAGGSCADNELATQLARRSQLVHTVSTYSFNLYIITYIIFGRNIKVSWSGINK